MLDEAPHSPGAVDALHEIALLIAAETELDAILERVLRATESLLGAASSSVYLRTGGRGRRFTTLYTGQPHWEDKPINVRPGGITETVIRQGHALPVEDVRALPNPSAHLLEHENLAILAAPLRCQSEVIGVLYANFHEPRPFAEAACRLIETLGAYAATAVRNAELLASERRSAERLMVLLEMARAVSSGGELHPVLRLICGHSRRLLGCDSVVLHRLRPDGLVEGLAMDTGSSRPRIREAWRPGEHSQQAIAERRPVVVERPRDNPNTAVNVRAALEGIEVVLIAPLSVDDECLGLLMALWSEPHRVDEAERQLVETIAGQAALAMKSHASREAAIEAARLEGAIKTAQAAAHELSQPLAVVVGYSELLEATDNPQEARRMVEMIARAADTATAKLDRFRKVMRFVELRFGSLDPILDVERSSEQEAPRPAPWKGVHGT